MTKVATFCALLILLLLPSLVLGDSGTFYADDLTDDGYWYDPSGFINDSNGHVVGAGNYHCFVKFENVTIPKDAVIINAHVTFYCQTVYITDVDTIMYFEAADTATAPTSHAEADALSLTSGTAFSPEGWNGLNSPYNTGSLVSELQEVISRPGWSSGNDAMFVWKYDADVSYRPWHSYESDIQPGYEARLQVEYNPVFEAGGCVRVGDGLCLK